MAIGDWGFRAEFVGRREEFNELKQYIRTSIEGKGEVVFIEGEAGIGKTRLVEETRLWADGEQLDVKFITGRCLYHEDVNPYLPFLDALREYAQGAGAALEEEDAEQLERTSQELEKLVPYGFVQNEDTLLASQNTCPQLLPMSLIPMSRDQAAAEREEVSETQETVGRKIGELNIQQEKERMFRTITELLVKIADETPLVLMLDDIHWADRASLQLLPYIADHTRNTPLLIACTYRPEDLEVYSGEAHPLVETIQRMSRMNLFKKITLSRLTKDETRQMVESLFDQKHIPDEFVAHVYGKTEGNPFFIEEVARSLIEDGTIDVHDGSWPSKINVADIAIPETIHDVISRRLGRLTSESLNVLRLASVIGRSFHFAILLQASEKSEEQLLDIIDEVLDARLIREDFSTDEEVYKFDNIAVREVVYRMLSRSRRRVLHRKIAEALECLYHDNLSAIVFELAHHYSTAKDYRRATPYLVQAGEFSKASFAPDDAKMFFKRALAAVSKLPDDLEARRTKCDLLLRLGELAYVTAEWDNAVDYYDQAHQYCDLLDDARNCGLAHRTLGHIYKEKGEWEHAVANYEEAMAIAKQTDDHSSIADIERGRGYIHWRRGDLDAAIQCYNRSIDSSRTAGDIGVLGQTFIEIGNIYGDKAEWRQASEFYLKAIEILSNVGELNELARAYNNLGDLYLQNESWEKALQYFKKCDETSKKIGNRSMIAWSAFNMAECYINLDRMELAEELAESANEILHDLNEKIGIASVNRIYGKIYQKKGEWGKAESHFSTAIRMLGELEIPFELANAYFELGMLRIAERDLAAAEDEFSHSLRLYTKVGSGQNIAKTSDVLGKLREDRAAKQRR